MDVATDSAPPNDAAKGLNQLSPSRIWPTMPRCQDSLVDIQDHDCHPNVLEHLVDFNKHALPSSTRVQAATLSKQQHENC